MEVEKARLFRLTVVIINRFDNVAQRELIEDLLFLLRILHGRLHGYASKAKSLLYIKCMTAVRDGLSFRLFVDCFALLPNSSHVPNL